MGQRKAPVRAKRVVWRISEAAPLGEFVDLDAVKPAPPPPVPSTDQPGASRGGWAMSSFELLHGTEISEGGDTVPDDLFDELFSPPAATPPTPGDEQVDEKSE